MLSGLPPVASKADAAAIITITTSLFLQFSFSFHGAAAAAVDLFKAHILAPAIVELRIHAHIYIYTDKLFPLVDALRFAALKAVLSRAFLRMYLVPAIITNEHSLFFTIKPLLRLRPFAGVVSSVVSACSVIFFLFRQFLVGFSPLTP